VKQYIVKVETGVVVAVRRWRMSGDVPIGWFATIEHVGIGWAYDGSTFTAPPVVPKTPAEKEAQLQAEIDEKVGQNASAIDLAQFYLDADLYRAQNMPMTVAAARTAVRGRMEVHLRAIKLARGN
jgi:hypothetical protein